MYRPRQAIPRCMSRMHWIKETAETPNPWTSWAALGREQQDKQRISWLEEQHPTTLQEARQEGIRHGILHRARDKEIIKEYSYSQCLCYDWSTIERESELSTTKAGYTYYTFTLVPWCKTSQWNSTLHRMDQCSTTHTEATQWHFQVINQSIYRTTAHHALHHFCLVSEPTILYFCTNVSSPQP